MAGTMLKFGCIIQNELSIFGGAKLAAKDPFT
jgi:hypothetical protein